LAFASAEKQTSFRSQVKLEQFTRNTLHDFARLDEEIERVKQNGIAIDNEEYIGDMWSAAAPVYDTQNQVIAALPWFSLPSASTMKTSMTSSPR